MLRDKQVDQFKHLDLKNVEEVFHRLSKHYGTSPFTAQSSKQIQGLRDSARRVNQFSSLALTTTESLAHVYEHTLISKRTQTTLGTHSTPSFLVGYFVRNL